MPPTLPPNLRMQVPTYLACTILPVYDWVGPGPFALGYPMRPATAMRMAFDALEQVRGNSVWPRADQPAV